MRNARYLGIPINFAKLNQGARIRDIDFNESIAQYIYTILITECGELSSDKDFGTTVWDYDFTITNFTSEWKDSVSSSIGSAIKRYITQLDNIRVDVEIADEQYSDKVKNALRIKKKITIKVTGQLKSTKEDYAFNQSLYLSPITVE